MPPIVTRIAALGATVALALTLAAPAAQEAVADDRVLASAGLTATIPQVQNFTAGNGNAFFLTPTTRIIVGDATLNDEAALLVDELVALDVQRDLGMGRAPAVVTDASPVDGDIVLAIGAVTGTMSTEAYTLSVDGHTTITGPNDGAVFLGTRTLLQSLSNAGGAEAGLVKDWPDTTIRSLHIDGARKFYSPDFYAEQIRQMAWIKLNQLQYHFSENEGYRLESTSHPEIMSAEYLTKAQLADLINLAATYHIEVVPALDIPGHMQQALKSHTQWRASQTPEGQNILDYSKPEVRQFVTDLIDEYAPLFPSTAWHLGGDEVFDLYATQPIGQRFPTLDAYAKAEVGASATVMDGYVHYLNTVAEYLNGKGKTHVRAWNDALYTPGTTVALNSNVDVAYWTRWHGSFPTVATIKANGHRLINFNDAYFYYVLAKPGGAYATHPSPQKIWDEWKPGVFPKAANVAQNLATNDPSLAGASYAIWSDYAIGETEQQVSTGIKQSLRAMAGKSWKAESTGTFATFSTNSARISDAPVPTELVEPTLDLTLTADPTGTVDPGAEQDWSIAVANDGVVPARATVATDLSELLELATHGTATTTIVDADGVPVGAPGRNVALNRPATASGQEVAGQWGPALAVDGALDTRYSSNTSDSAWIAVQLAAPTVVDHVSIAWELAAARYKLQVSDNGTTWTDATAELAATPNTVSNVELTTTTPVRFVRMQSIERTPASNGMKYGVSMKEFEVWDGPEEGITFEDAVFNGTGLDWVGSLPADHTLVIEFTSTLDADATLATSYTVNSVVGAPYFPGIDTAMVTSKVSGTAPTASPSPSTSPSVTPTRPTVPSTSPSQSATPTPGDVYTQPGFHLVGGRQWYTTCEAYSRTTRCRTDIWSTSVEFTRGKFVKDTGWHFNNLTYLPKMTRAQWSGNPLGHTGSFVSEGRQWRTECDTAATGRGGCRSYIWSRNVISTQQPNGVWTYALEQDWVFNNMVLFRTN
ncbi:MAG: family 20 glycosylhydrolase [Arachnia sp.]